MLTIFARYLGKTCFQTWRGGLGGIVWVVIQVTYPWLWNPPLDPILWWLVLIVGTCSLGLTFERCISALEHVWQL